MSTISFVNEKCNKCNTNYIFMNNSSTLLPKKICMCNNIDLKEKCPYCNSNNIQRKSVQIGLSPPQKWCNNCRRDLTTI